MTDISAGPGSATNSPVRALLVEDNVADAELIRIAFESCPTLDIELHHSSSLSEAIAHVQQSPPDVVLLDLTLPESRGIQTLEGLIDHCRGSAIIVLTGLEDERLAQEALRKGAQDYLIKGQAEPSVLERAIRYSVERVRAALAVQAGERRYRAIIETTREGIATLDPEGRIDFVNPRLAEICSVPAGDLLGRQLRDLVEESDRARAIDLLRGGHDRDQETEFRLRTPDAEPVWVHVSAAPLRLDEASEPGTLVMFSDVSARKRVETEVEHLALHDSLTGLPNRALMESRVTHALARRSRMGMPLAVIVVELDRFRVINETLGHPVGDVLLTMVAQRLLDRMREEDTVARLGGDEFAVLLENIPDADTAKLVAGRLATAFEEPFEIMGEKVRISASLGIALGSGEQKDPSALLRHAEIAMYRAKDEQGVSIQLFDPKTDFSATRRLKLESELRDAIANGDLCVHYQPLIGLDSGRVLGAEALVRWAHPTRGFMFPTEFIALAEETGLIRELGKWVMEQACERAAHWRDGLAPDFVISVNISPRQLEDADLPGFVERVCTASGLDPAGLQLEITESAAMRGVSPLQRFRQLGVRVAIDDVGRGFSSLEYLARLEVDLLKIDRAFVGGLGSSSRDGAVIEAILLLGERIGLGVVAEGIETEEQLRRLQDLGCGTGQGYLFSKPVDGAAFQTILERGSYDRVKRDGTRDLVAV